MRSKKQKKLQQLRKTAHVYFDMIWLYKLYYGGRTVQYWRNRQYKWLAKQLDIPRSECHMSTMTENQCKKVIDICAAKFAKNENMINFAERYEEGKVMNWYKLK